MYRLVLLGLLGLPLGAQTGEPLGQTMGLWRTTGIEGRTMYTLGFMAGFHIGTIAEGVDQVAPREPGTRPMAERFDTCLWSISVGDLINIVERQKDDKSLIASAFIEALSSGCSLGAIPQQASPEHPISQEEINRTLEQLKRSNYTNIATRRTASQNEEITIMRSSSESNGSAQPPVQTNTQPAAQDKFQLPKRGVPYLLVGDDLIEMEVAEAQTRISKDQRVYYVIGATSPTKTTNLRPIMMAQSTSLPEIAGRMKLYRMTANNGIRELLFSVGGKLVAVPIPVVTTPISATLYRFTVNENLAPGEYGLSPEGSNQVYLFTVE